MYVLLFVELGKLFIKPLLYLLARLGQMGHEELGIERKDRLNAISCHIKHHQKLAPEFSMGLLHDCIKVLDVVVPLLRHLFDNVLLRWGNHVWPCNLELSCLDTSIIICSKLCRTVDK